MELDIPDIALVDVQLPDGCGFSVCSRLRFDLGIPVLLLTARSSDTDVIAGFEQGAEDYVTKPFSMQILLLRLRSVLSRAVPKSEASKASKRVFQIGRGLFRVGHNEIVVDGTAHRLTTTEGRILQLLMSHEGQLLSAEQIIEDLWGYDSDTNASVVKTHIRNLRVKLSEALGHGQYIRTQHRLFVSPALYHTCVCLPHKLTAILWLAGSPESGAPVRCWPASIVRAGHMRGGNGP